MSRQLNLTAARKRDDKGARYDRDTREMKFLRMIVRVFQHNLRTWVGETLLGTHHA